MDTIIRILATILLVLLALSTFFPILLKYALIGMIFLVVIGFVMMIWDI